MTLKTVMEGPSKREPTQKLIDRKTGREVVIRPPHSGFRWKEGHVLRSVTDEQAQQGFERENALIGGAPFEWVSKDEVELG